MAILGAEQRLDNVVPGLPWGDGSNGSQTYSSDPNTRTTATGSSTSITLASAILSDGDVFLIHQTRSTSSAGFWEFAKVASGGGTTSITTTKALVNTYASGSQVVLFTMDSDVTINAHSITAWGGSTGGIAVYCGKDSITIAGNLTGTGNGYKGGAGQADPGSAAAGDGESSYGDPGTEATGAGDYASTAAGAGGGYGTAGGDIGGANGGDVHGSADLTVIDFGGGGAGGSSNPDGGAGGDSGGAIIFITKNFVASAATVINNGADGSTAPGDTRGGGGGSGGAVLVVCETATVGSDKITATGGAGGGGTVSGAAGGDGRIAVHHSKTITITSTDPSYEDVEDATLIETAGTLNLTSKRW